MQVVIQDGEGNKLVLKNGAWGRTNISHIDYKDGMEIHLMSLDREEVEKFAQALLIFT